MDARLKRIDAIVKQYTDAYRPTVFLLLNGESFRTDLDPLAYLMQHGVETPLGRIVGVERRPGGTTDPLSESLYDLIDEGIRAGGLQDLLALESDEA